MENVLKPRVVEKRPDGVDHSEEFNQWLNTPFENYTWETEPLFDWVSASTTSEGGARFMIFMFTITSPRN